MQNRWHLPGRTYAMLEKFVWLVPRTERSRDVKTMTANSDERKTSLYRHARFDPGIHVFVESENCRRYDNAMLRAVVFRRLQKAQFL